MSVDTVEVEFPYQDDLESFERLYMDSKASLLDLQGFIQRTSLKVLTKAIDYCSTLDAAWESDRFMDMNLMTDDEYSSKISRSADPTGTMLCLKEDFYEAIKNRVVPYAVTHHYGILDDDHSAIEKPAALIMESVQAEGGIFPFSNEFLRGVREFCDKNDILLIIDDVQMGCCRTGTFFSFERAGIAPDMVVMSKSIGGMGMPLAILLLKEELDCWKPGEHNGTFRGNQLSFVAGAASFDYLLENNVEAETRRKGELVKSFLEKEVLPLDPRLQVRGMGLIWGIDFSAIDPELSEAVIEKCFDERLICECAGRNGAVFKIMPPLVIEDELLMKGLEIVAKAVKEVLR